MTVVLYKSLHKCQEACVFFILLVCCKNIRIVNEKHESNVGPDLMRLFFQSSEALEFIKRDLAEFSTVVQHDTACSIVATATAVKNKLAVTISVPPSYHVLYSKIWNI